MKVFITKYALTEGILERDALYVTANLIGVYGKGYYTYYTKGEWYETMNGAKQQAEIMRRNEINNLSKQLDELQKMSFF